MTWSDEQILKKATHLATGGRMQNRRALRAILSPYSTLDALIPPWRKKSARRIPFLAAERHAMQMLFGHGKPSVDLIEQYPLDVVLRDSAATRGAFELSVLSDTVTRRCVAWKLVGGRHAN